MQKNISLELTEALNSPKSQYLSPEKVFVQSSVFTEAQTPRIDQRNSVKNPHVTQPRSRFLSVTSSGNSDRKLFAIKPVILHPFKAFSGDEPCEAELATTGLLTKTDKSEGFGYSVPSEGFLRPRLEQLKSNSNFSLGPHLMTYESPEPNEDYLSVFGSADYVSGVGSPRKQLAKLNNIGNGLAEEDVGSPFSIQLRRDSAVSSQTLAVPDPSEGGSPKKPLSRFNLKVVRSSTSICEQIQDDEK